jgi:hypothetical protein
MVYSYAGFQFLYLAHEWSAKAMDKKSLEKVAGDFLYMPNRTEFINYDYALIKDLRKFIPKDEEGFGFTIWNTIYGSKEAAREWHRVTEANIELRDVLGNEMLFFQVGAMKKTGPLYGGHGSGVSRW